MANWVFDNQCRSRNVFGEVVSSDRQNFSYPKLQKSNIFQRIHCITCRTNIEKKSFICRLVLFPVDLLVSS